MSGRHTALEPDQVRRGGGVGGARHIFLLYSDSLFETNCCGANRCPSLSTNDFLRSVINWVEQSITDYKGYAR